MRHNTDMSKIPVILGLIGKLIKKPPHHILIRCLNRPDMKFKTIFKCFYCFIFSRIVCCNRFVYMVSVEISRFLCPVKEILSMVRVGYFNH